MVSETCRRLQRAAVDDTSLWAHVELPVNDGRVQQEDKEQFLCRLLRRSAAGGGGDGGGGGSAFVTPTKPPKPAPPPAAAADAAGLHDDKQEDEEEDDDESADFPRGHACMRGGGHDSPSTPSSSPSSPSSSSYHCRAPHVRSLSLLGAREVTGGCLLAFSPSPRPSHGAAAFPSCSLRELDLSHCRESARLLCLPLHSSIHSGASLSINPNTLKTTAALQLPLLAQALPSVRRSLTSLSLRNTDHLLNDEAIARILAHLALQSAEEMEDAGLGLPLTGAAHEGRIGVATGLRALHLGTSTRKGARPAPELTDATLLRLCACCPWLETLSLHNQAAVTDEGLVALAGAVGGSLRGLDLGLCSSLSDATMLALAGKRETARRIDDDDEDDDDAWAHRHATTDDTDTNHHQTQPTTTAHCRGLRRLSLRNCWRVTDSAVRSLLLHNPHLEALNLYCCTFLSPRALSLHLDDTPAAAAAAAAAAADGPLAPALLPPPLPPAAAASWAGEASFSPLALREANLSYMRRWVVGDCVV